MPHIAVTALDELPAVVEDDMQGTQGDLQAVAASVVADMPAAIEVDPWKLKEVAMGAVDAGLAVGLGHLQYRVASTEAARLHQLSYSVAQSLWGCARAPIVAFYTVSSKRPALFSMGARLYFYASGSPSCFSTSTMR